MGGMAHYAKEGVSAERNQGKEAFPVYLQPEKAKGLFELPVTFGEKKASQVTQTAATIDYHIVATGAHSTGILYYGTSDANAFIASTAPQTSAPGESFQHNILSNGWKTWTPEQDVKAGLNQFKLANLTPNTIYYFRLYVVHDDGRSWDYTPGKS